MKSIQARRSSVFGAIGALVLLFASNGALALTTLTVTLPSDNNPGGFGEISDLRYCLNTMNQGLNTAPDDYAIVFASPMTIQLNGLLPLVNNSANPVNVTIGNPGSGPTVTIDGNSGAYSGFFTPMGNVTIRNMVFQNMTTRGGKGGDGISGGGGGMGAGGAIYAPQLFLNGSNPSITLVNVSTNNTAAIGGNGGSYLGFLTRFDRTETQGRGCHASRRQRRAVRRQWGRRRQRWRWWSRRGGYLQRRRRAGSQWRLWRRWRWRCGRRRQRSRRRYLCGQQSEFHAAGTAGCSDHLRYIERNDASGPPWNRKQRRLGRLRRVGAGEQHFPAQRFHAHADGGSLTLNAPSVVHTTIDPGGASVVAVNGPASLAGTLQIDLDPAVAGPGTYAVLTWAGITGTFASVTFTAATPADYVLSYLPSGTPTFVQLHVLAAQAIANFAATPASSTYAPGGTFAVAAAGGASGNPVTFSIAPVSATVCSAGGANGATITMLAAGTCTVQADQAGNASYAAATPAMLDVVLSAAFSTLTLASSPNPSTPYAPVTFTATVGTGAPAGIPAAQGTGSVQVATGTVSFTDCATPLGTVNLVDGA